MKQYTLGSVVRAGAWGVLVGGAAGFALGVLLAPEEGQTVRRRLVYQMEHLAAQIGTFIDQVVNPEAQSEARRTGDAVIADAEARAMRIRRDIDQLLGEMRSHGSPRESS